MYGLMAVSTTDNGSTTKWKGRVPSPGAMDVVMLVNIRMIKNMDKVHLNGLMVVSISANGTKVNNMARELI